MRKRWTDDEVDWLRLCYPVMHTAKVAKVIGRTIGQCYQKAQALGLTKTPEYLATDDARRLSASRRTPAMRATQFQPGQVSWNKGVKGVTGMQEACRATQFKPGRPPSEAANYVPIGTLRLSKDGYLQRKVTDDRAVVPAQRWVAEHRLVWEATNGPVPAGSVVVFKPGRKTVELELITVDALEVLTRVELMQRNSVHTQYPPEVARLVQLRGALTRQINARARALEES
ncbi:HNH endonuclease [Variovorax sp.]|jgi:hypothetical protein|uniref:HNH endonuclease n=1 Tax=Variovorax sp. TaxID=1871043 RepID=UPI0040380E84